MTHTRLGLTTATFEAPKEFLDVIADVLDECIENTPAALDRSLEDFHTKIEQRVERFAETGPTIESRDDLLLIAVTAVTALAKITREGAE